MHQGPTVKTLQSDMGLPIVISKQSSASLIVLEKCSNS
jgi:hypothetical protein